MPQLHVIDVARICHETNRAYRKFLGESDSGAWGDVAEEKRQSAIRGVQFAIDNPRLTPGQSHDRWMEEAVNAGHINMKPFHELDSEQQAKDAIFLGVVNACRPFLED